MSSTTNTTTTTTQVYARGVPTWIKRQALEQFVRKLVPGKKITNFNTYPKDTDTHIKWLTFDVPQEDLATTLQRIQSKPIPTTKCHLEAREAVDGKGLVDRVQIRIVGIATSVTRPQLEAHIAHCLGLPGPFRAVISQGTGPHKGRSNYAFVALPWGMSEIDIECVDDTDLHGMAMRCNLFKDQITISEARRYIPGFDAKAVRESVVAKNKTILKRPQQQPQQVQQVNEEEDQQTLVHIKESEPSLVEKEDLVVSTQLVEEQHQDKISNTVDEFGSPPTDRIAAAQMLSSVIARLSQLTEQVHQLEDETEARVQALRDELTPWYQSLDSLKVLEGRLISTVSGGVGHNWSPPPPQYREVTRSPSPLEEAFENFGLSPFTGRGRHLIIGSHEYL